MITCQPLPFPAATDTDAEGHASMPDLVERDFAVEDLPGAYSLDPISIDEAIVADRLDPDRTNDGALATPRAAPRRAARAGAAD